MLRSHFAGNLTLRGIAGAQNALFSAFGEPVKQEPQKITKRWSENPKYCKFYVKPVLLTADLYIYFRKGVGVKTLLGILKKTPVRSPILRFLVKWELKHKAKILKGTQSISLEELL